jgi:RHS repeat-associated protein
MKQSIILKKIYMPAKIIVSISLLLLGSLVQGQVVAPTDNTGSLDATMNWVRSKVYDANGNIVGEGKVFYDQGGRLLQEQQKVKYRLSGGSFVTHVLARQPLFDALGRPVAQTMSAPIDASQFVYKSNFVRNTGGTTYDYRNFDKFNPSGSETDNTNNPNAVGGQSVLGTLGWYYGNNNTWEPYVPTTSYPYNRETIYKDGTGNTKKFGGNGEVFKMGAGKESANYITPADNEVAHYIQVRNTFFTSGEVGEVPSSLIRKAMQTVAQDANGKEFVTILDGSGASIMKARPGNDLTVTNTVSLSTVGRYNVTANKTNFFLDINSNQIVEIYDSPSGILIYQGRAGNITYPNPAPANIEVRSEAPFGYLHCPSSPCPSPTPASGGLNQLYYFKILADNSDVTITGTYTLYNMATETTTSLIGGNKLNKGYYKVVATSGNVTLTYTNKLAEVSYSFYNQLGQVIATIAPEGVKKLFGGGISNYATKNDIPFITLFEYDVQGRLVKVKSADGGTSEMVYRKDGKLRFSQDASQQLTGRYAYMNYDDQGRMIETGEYQPDGGGIVFNSDLSTSTPMKNILEDISATGGLTTGTKNAVIRIKYDVVDATHAVAGYTQNEFYLRYGISMIEKLEQVVNNNYGAAPKVSATWYNYDELGSVVWLIQFISGLGYKTINYTYDSDGKPTKAVYQQNTAAETFVHYYEYDAQQRLEKVYTNTVDNPGTKSIQATYIYYLHGPLKRILLSTNLQGIDYTYTLDGRLKAVNNSNKNADPGGDGANGIVTDAFGMVLDYYPDDYVNGRAGVQAIKGVNTAIVGSTSYIGNIKSMTWFSKKPVSVPPLTDDPFTSAYHYDNNYQFVENVWGTGINFANTPATFTITGFNKELVRNPSTGDPAYDANGNIQFLQRTNGAGTTVDRFAYSYYNTITGTGSPTNYNTNKLHSIVNDASGTPVTYATYTYDAAGRLTYENTNDPAKKKYVRYDAAGNVTVVARDAAFTQKVVEFEYDELGQRVKKKLYNGSYVLYQVTYYVSGVVYTQPVTGGVTYGAITVQEYEITGSNFRLGLYYRPTDVYAYELSDHLGNVRAVIARSGAASYDVRVYNDYYPFGGVVQNSGIPYRFGYQGQYSEKDAETDWNAFALRMYDSRIARWLSVDPAQEFFSAYLAMGNNPINMTDADGGNTDPVPCPDCPTNGKHLDTYRSEENGRYYWNDHGVWTQHSTAGTLQTNYQYPAPIKFQWFGWSDYVDPYYNLDKSRFYGRLYSKQATRQAGDSKRYLKNEEMIHRVHDKEVEGRKTENIMVAIVMSPLLIYASIEVGAYAISVSAPTITTVATSISTSVSNAGINIYAVGNFVFHNAKARVVSAIITVAGKYLPPGVIKFIEKANSKFKDVMKGTVKNAKAMNTYMKNIKWDDIKDFFR